MKAKLGYTKYGGFANIRYFPSIILPVENTTRAKLGAIEDSNKAPAKMIFSSSSTTTFNRLLNKACPRCKPMNQGAPPPQDSVCHNARTFKQH